jgi:hypothetical protein
MNEIQVKNEMTQTMVEGFQLELYEQATGRNSNNLSGGGLASIHPSRESERESRESTGTESGQVDPNLAGMPSLIPIHREIPIARRTTLFDIGVPTAGMAGVEAGEYTPMEYESGHPENIRAPSHGRNTFLVAHQDTAPEIAAGARHRQVAVGTVIHTQEKIHPSQQVNFLTLPALRVAIEHQTQHAAMYDQYKNLAFFVVAPCLRDLVANEHRLNRNWDMTEYSILTQPDEAFIGIFCSYIRVMSMGTKTSFTATILSAVPPLKALKDTGPNRREMVLDNYDIDFHASVSKHVDHLDKAFKHAFRGATLDETRFWPAENYGKGLEFGQIQILCKTLGPYRDNFQNRIGLENLKNMRSRAQWFQEIKRHNDELANIACQLRANSSQIAPMEKLDDIAKSVELKRSGPRVLMTKDGPRDIRLPNTPHPGTSGNYSGPPAPSRYPPRDFSRPQAPSYGRAAEIDFVNGLWNADEIFRYDHPLFEDETTELRKQGVELDPDDDERRWRLFDQEQESSLNAMNPTRGPYMGPKTLYDPDAKEVPVKPCYKHFSRKDCPGNCGFTHSQEAMQKLMRERLAFVLDSPYTPMEYVEQEVARRRQKKGGATMASLSRAFGTGSSEEDPTDFVNELSQLTGLQSPGSRNDPHSPVAPSSVNQGSTPVFTQGLSSANRESS